MRSWIVAYLDPGTGGLVLQFLLGGIAGLAAFIKYRWHNMRSRFGRGGSTIDE